MLEGGEIKISWNNLLLDSKYFVPDQIGAPRCFLGMFRGDTLKYGEWELGAIAMQDYYIVYDLEVKVDQ